MTRSCVVFLHGSTYQDRYQAVTLAVTAAALGDRVTLALFFDPLRLWVDGRFDEGGPAPGGPAHVASLRETVEEAREALDLEVVACDTALRMAGLDPSLVRDRIDRVASLPDLWRRAREGTQVVV